MFHVQCSYFELYRAVAGEVWVSIMNILQKIEISVTTMHPALDVASIYANYNGYLND